MCKLERYNGTQNAGWCVCVCVGGGSRDGSEKSCLIVYTTLNQFNAV